MGVYNKYGTIAVGAYMAHQPGSHPRAFTDQYYPQWDRGGARGPRTWKDPNRFDSLWSFGCKVGGGTGGGTDGDGVVGEMGHGFEPFSCDGPGCQFKNRIKGSCVDNSDVAVANATVQAFVTATDAYAGEGISRLDGTYEVLVEQQTSTAHYLVAYKVGAPDIAGTTVNTLLPTAS